MIKRPALRELPEIEILFNSISVFVWSCGPLEGLGLESSCRYTPHPEGSEFVEPPHIDPVLIGSCRHGLNLSLQSFEASTA